MNGGTISGQVLMTFGGVGRNVADCLMRLGQDVLFITAIGDDYFGDFVNKKNPNLHREGTKRLNGRTTAVCSVNLDDKKECLFVVADMKIHDHITPQVVSKFKDDIVKAPIVVVDANIPSETIDYVLKMCNEARIPVWFEPTDVHKAGKLFQSQFWKTVTFASPNLNELRTMSSVAYGTANTPDMCHANFDSLLRECTTLGRHLVESIHTLVVTLGNNGVLVISSADLNQPFPLTRDHLSAKGMINACYYPPIKKLSEDEIVSVSGAGDCLAGAIVASVLEKRNLKSCIRSGLEAAQLSVQSHATVPDSIDRSTVYRREKQVDWRPVILF